MPRRRTVTADHEASAFADERARELLLRARAARVAQDSALRAYQAKTWQRLSVGLGVRGYDRMLLRTENASRVTWSRGAGVWVEPTGRRAAAPAFGEGSVSSDLHSVTPIPYFPGRESLWTPSSYARVAQAEVSENELIHPLATGAEAYYRYASGDSISFSLPNGRRIALRELRITSRGPDWRAVVGSFWFDTEQGHLVRAAYRSAADLDIWDVIGEDDRKEIEAEIDRHEGEVRKRTGAGIVARGLLHPLRARISSITVEYGLHEGRFWLPRRNVAEALAQAGFLTMPIRLEERFTYEGVNVATGLPPVPTAAEIGLAASDTSLSGSLTIDITRRSTAGLSGDAERAREDSLVRTYLRRADSLAVVADSLTTRGDTAGARKVATRVRNNRRNAGRIVSRRESCASSGTHVSDVGSRFDGALRIAVRMPCDTTVLANSPDLPGSIFDAGEEVFGSADRDALLASLDFSLQPGWDPQPPVLHTGLDLLRYNRIEGLSVGASATSELGKGYTASLVARVGTGDWVPNADLALTRTNGRTALRVGAFHRLGVANDGWGAPLSFGASVANLAYARDEGFYYRTWGLELGGSRDAPAVFGGAALDWRLFAERQRSAGATPNVQASLAHLMSNTSFTDNIEATALTAVGAEAELARSFGFDPRGFRLAVRSQAEGTFTHRSDALGATGYGRLMLDAAMTRGFGSVAAAVTGAAGTSVGDLPLQRAYFMGGLHTVRGQFARLTPGEGRIGNAFWLGRAELGHGVGVRKAVFYDIGWAGAREDFARPGRPMQGAGVGVSLLDGLVRTDLSRGIWPEQRWRLDVQLAARF